MVDITKFQTPSDKVKAPQSEKSVSEKSDVIGDLIMMDGGD